MKLILLNEKPAFLNVEWKDIAISLELIALLLFVFDYAIPSSS